MMAGVSTTGEVDLRQNVGVAGVVRSGRIIETTDETRLETADKAEISAEGPLLVVDAELCIQLRDMSEDLRFAGSNTMEFGGSLSVATQSYCEYQHIGQIE
jgi:hypothetical protein